MRATVFSGHRGQDFGPAKVKCDRTNRKGSIAFRIPACVTIRIVPVSAFQFYLCEKSNKNIFRAVCPAVFRGVPKSITCEMYIDKLLILGTSGTGALHQPRKAIEKEEQRMSDTQSAVRNDNDRKLNLVAKGFEAFSPHNTDSNVLR